jgi:hypothetical protein
VTPSSPSFDSCKAWAVAKGVFHVGLDFAGAIPFIGAPVSAVNALSTEGAATYQFAAGLITNDYSDLKGTGITFAGAAVAIAAKNAPGAAIFAAKSVEAGSKFAEAVPWLGVAVGAVATAYDAHSAYTEYNECK